MPQVKTGTEAGWLQRAQRVKLVGGPMNGLSLEMWLQRQVNAGKKKRSSRYATTAQYKVLLISTALSRLWSSQVVCL